MSYSFTPAAQRAITAAQGWFSGDELADLQPQELLLGLLAEPECRAAGMLAAQGIDAEAVRRRWPELRDNRPQSTSRPFPFSADLDASLRAAQQRLAHLPRPLQLATEHLLLGLAAGQSEVGHWLCQQGISPDELVAEIDQRYGFSEAPLEIDLDALSGTPAAPQLQQVNSGAGEQVSGCQTTVLRVIDAAANRGREALRVIEDYVRFAMDDRLLTAEAKQLRHELTAVLSQIDAAGLLAARDTSADVGTGLSTAAETTRRDLASLVTANFKRLEESLRSLEEFGKLLDSAAAARCKQLRYATYTLERMVGIVGQSAERLAGAQLYVLLDGRHDAVAFEALARELINAGVHVLQLRDKSLTDRQLLQRATQLRELTRGTGTLCIINDRADIAARASADGVHLGQEELSVRDARALVGPTALIGVSTHSLPQLRQAVRDGANYVGVGPTFPSHTKQFAEFPGLELLRAAAIETTLPAFAIGGIDAANLADVLATGIRRVAVRSAVCDARDPGTAATALLKELAAPAKSPGAILHKQEQIPH